MNESKGWVHWHPDGYVLDIEDDKALGMKNAGVFHDIGAAERWVNVCLESKKSLVVACEVITYEEAVRRLAQAAMKSTAEELRSARETSPKPILNPNMAPKAMAEELRAGRAAMPKATAAEAYAQQERAMRGETRKPTEDRMLVEFRLDPSKYRVRVRPRGNLFEAYVQTADGIRPTIMAFSHMPEIAVARALGAANVPAPGALMPHPWKRPDGLHIKASWEE